MTRLEYQEFSRIQFVESKLHAQFINIRVSSRRLLLLGLKYEAINNSQTKTRLMSDWS